MSEVAAKLKKTFSDMVKAVHKHKGGSAVCRIPDSDGHIVACIVYVEGITAGTVAAEADKIQEAFENAAKRGREKGQDNVRSLPATRRIIAPDFVPSSRRKYPVSGPREAVAPQGESPRDGAGEGELGAAYPEAGWDPSEREPCG